MYGNSVPDDAQPGDLVVGNRGAAARVVSLLHNTVLSLEYAGNYHDGMLQPAPGRKMYDFR